MLRRNGGKVMASLPHEFIGASGCRYRFQELLQERPHLGRVWLAMSAISLPFISLPHELTFFSLFFFFLDLDKVNSY